MQDPAPSQTQVAHPRPRGHQILAKPRPTFGVSLEAHESVAISVTFLLFLFLLKLQILAQQQVTLQDQGPGAFVEGLLGVH